MSDELKPCPFCGGEDIDGDFVIGHQGGDITKPLVASGCWNCSACGPDKPTKQEAIEAWNKRAPTK